MCLTVPLPRSLFVAAFTLSTSFSPLWGAMNILGYNPDLHDRFDSSSFIGSSFDWSGVGREVGAQGPWATMIGQRHFISANHFHPDVGDDVTFIENNSSTGTSVTRTVDSGQRIGSTDLWVGEFGSAVPASIKIYDLASQTADFSTGDLGSFYNDVQTYQVGLRDDWNVAGLTNFAVGLNNLEIGDSTSEALGTFDALGFAQDETGDTNLNNPGETFFVTGDSGAPSFVEISGELTIVGTHAYTTNSGISGNNTQLIESQSPYSPLNQPGPPTTRDVSFDNFTPNYRNDILAAVPEPATYALLIGILALGCTTLRRRPRVSV